MTGKRKVLAVGAAIHLALAAIYAPHIPAERFLPGAVDRAFSLYGGFSGVRTHFDFFAPSVATQARAVFRIIGADGSVRQVQLATPSAEANNRIALMLTYYSYAGERQLLRTWGQYMLRLHPEAVAVESRIEALEIPTLERYAAGRAEPKWVELGRTLVRKADAPGT